MCIKALLSPLHAFTNSICFDFLIMLTKNIHKTVNLFIDTVTPEKRWSKNSQGRLGHFVFKPLYQFYTRTSHYFWSAGADPASVIRGGPNSEHFLLYLRKLRKRGKFFLTTQSLTVKRNWVYIFIKICKLSL